MTDLDRLVSEFAAAFEAGDEPDPAAFLAQVEVEERPELADRLDAYLLEAPAPDWDPAAYERSPAKQAVTRAFESIEGVSGSWPELLPSLRNRARITRATVAERLASALGFAGDRERVHGYLHRMEHGRLPAPGVSDRVLDALADIVGTTREALRLAGASSGAGPEPMAGTFARAVDPDPQYALLELSDADAADSATAPPSPEERRDELDELFLGPGD